MNKIKIISIMFLLLQNHIGFAGKNSGAAKNSWEKENKGKKDFHCNYCDKKFTTIDEFKNHFFDITKGISIKISDANCGPINSLSNCRICGQSVVNETTHLNKVHFKQFICDCGYRCGEENYLKKHMEKCKKRWVNNEKSISKKEDENSNDINPIKLNLFLSEDVFQKKSRQVNSYFGGVKNNSWEEENKDKKDFECNFCNKIFSTIDEYKNHFFNIKEGISVKMKRANCGPCKALSNCRICGQSIVKEHDHLNNIHFKRFICECGYRSGSANRLKKHIEKCDKTSLEKEANWEDIDQEGFIEVESKKRKREDLNFEDINNNEINIDIQNILFSNDINNYSLGFTQAIEGSSERIEFGNFQENKKNKLEEISIVLDNEINKENNKSPDEIFNYILSLINMNDLLGLTSFLNQNPDFINIKNMNGYSLLHCAVLVGDIEIAKLLLILNIEIDAQSKFGERAIDLAISSNNKEMIKLLEVFKALK